MASLDDLESEHWENWLGDFDHTGYVARPQTKDELLDVVRWAVGEGWQIRAVGSGHSHSVCARPSQLFVDISAITGPFDRVDWLKDEPPGVGENERLVRIRAGTTIKQINRLHLPTMSPPLGLTNAGTFDGQTIAGAISTGTHGTGIRLGSLADMVVSMDIVTVTQHSDGSPDVRMRRIEPTDGVTNPTLFERAHESHGMVLEQDDDLFYSMVVSYGCMGIAYAYTLKVRDEYWLREDTELIEWPDLAAQLDEKTRTPTGIVPALADSARHVWFMLNIAEMQGADKTQSPACFLTKRRITGAETRPRVWLKAWPPERKSDFWKELAQDLGGLDPTEDHDGIGRQIRENIENNDVGEPAFQGNHWSSVSYIVHRREQEDRADDTPPEPPPPAISIEIAVPATDVVAALEAAIDCVEQSELFFISPWGVRFSDASGHYLSPAYDRATAWIEIVFALPTPLLRPDRTLAEVRDTIAKPELTKIETALCYGDELEGRPHLGKHNTLDRSRLEQLFPELATWLAAYRRFNAFGTFSSQFTDQLGLDQDGQPPAEEEPATWLEPVLHVMLS
jgi:L-gulono-1,4-lactone dehydrogenase